MLRQVRDPPLPQRRFHFAAETREIPFNDPPDLFRVHALVAVDQHVAEAGDPPPGYLRTLRLESGGEPFDRFADDLEVADDRVLLLERLEKGLLSSPGELLDPADALQNVDQVEGVVLHSGTA